MGHWGTAGAEERKLISRRQLKAIWALSHRLELDEPDLRSMIRQLTGKESMRTLTRLEAREVLDLLLERTRSVDSAGKEDDRHRGGATGAQMALLLSLAEEIHWDADRTLRLARNMYHVARLDDLKIRQASGLIEALKAIKNRRVA